MAGCSSQMSPHNPEAAGSSPAPLYCQGLSQKYGADPIILNLQLNSNLLKFKYEQRRKR